MKGVIFMEDQDIKKSISVIESWIARLSPFGYAPGVIRELLNSLTEIRAQVIHLSEELSQKDMALAEKEHQIKVYQDKIREWEVRAAKALGEKKDEEE